MSTPNCRHCALWNLSQAEEEQRGKSRRWAGRGWGILHAVSITISGRNIRDKKRRKLIRQRILCLGQQMVGKF